MVERASFVGQHVGNYRLVQLLGTGGFAEVYLGMHVHLNTHVAVKLLHTRLASEDVEDFRREAQMIARLIHPNIIRVLDFGVEGNTPYLVMDYAPDGTLRQRHPKGSIIAPQLVVGYVKQIAEALQHAHELRLIHRDVKPENMLLGRSNEVLLSDFGIALAAQSSQYQSTQNVAGTISYMAPEQIQAHPRPASDQYSLGVVVYEWLSGNRPFQGSFTEIAVKHAMVPPAPLRERLPQLPPAVEEVVMIALAKDPHRRFVNVRAFAHAFEQAALQNALPHPSLLASQIMPPSPNMPSGSYIPGGTMTYIPDISSTVLNNNRAGNAHSTGISYSASGQPMLPGNGSYASGAQNGYPMGGPGMPYGNAGFGASMNQGGQYGNSGVGSGGNQGAHYGNGPLSQREIHQVGGTFQSYGSRINDTRQKRLISRRTIIAGMVGLVTVSSALTWAVASRQGVTTSQTGGTTSTIQSGKTSSTTYTYPTPTAAVPPQLTYKGQQGYIWSVGWSPDGAYIVSGSADGTAHVWDCNNGNRVTAYRSHITPAQDNDWAKKVAWAPDSKRIAIGFTDSTTQGADINTEREIFSYSNPASKYPIESVGWSPNGRYVAAGDFGNTVVIYDVTSGQAITTYTDHSDSVLALAWSPDGKQIVSGSSDGTARVWDAMSGKTLLIYKKHGNDVESVAWSPDGSRVVSGGLDGTAQIWQVNGSYTLLTYTKHTGGIVNSVSWSPDGVYIASGGNDVNTHVWEAKSGNLLKEFYTFPIFGLAWSPDSKRIVTGGYNKVSQVWKVK
jgi:eukaryotic-like serine/threonine-protein kinase